MLIVNIYTAFLFDLVEACFPFGMFDSWSGKGGCVVYISPERRDPRPFSASPLGGEGALK